MKSYVLVLCMCQFVIQGCLTLIGLSLFVVHATDFLPSCQRYLLACWSCWSCTVFFNGALLECYVWAHSPCTVPYNTSSLRHVLLLFLAMNAAATINVQDKGVFITNREKKKKTGKTPFPGPSPNPNYNTKP